MAERSSLAIAAMVPLVCGAALSYAFMPINAGRPVVIGSIGATYAVLLVGTLLWMKKHGQLGRLLPKRGDITVGALLAVGMYMVATVVHLWLTGRGTPREPWMMRIYLQIGDPRTTARFAVGVGILALAAAEEVVWRGWVLGALSQIAKPTKAWLITTGLYALAHLPTVYLLRDPDAGLNPIIVAAAILGGLVWGFLALRIERLGPSIMAHALFSWAVVQYPIWRM